MPVQTPSPTRLATTGAAPGPAEGTTAFVTSADGTRIAFDRTGSGPALILVDGALCSRTLGTSGKLAAMLAGDFTVYRYDRRGRGESGDTEPWAPAREFEDLAAVIDAAGGSAAVYGISSGAVLALDAAARLPQITSVAAYEPPLVVHPTGNVVPDDFIARMREHLAAGRRGAAVRQFMDHVGTPRAMTAVMRRLPVWRKLEAVAHTLPYDLTLIDGLGAGRPLPDDRWATVTVPTLAMHGAKSPEWIAAGARALAAVLDGEHRTLPGQTHMVKPKLLAPELTAFFSRDEFRAQPAS